MKTSSFGRTYFELSRGGSDNLRSMEGLRGFAVFLVFLAHYATFTWPYLPRESLDREIVLYLRHLGNGGVDLFFVLSGYLIYGSFISRPQDLRVYARRRIVRIYPAYTAVLLVYVVLNLFHPDGGKLAGTPGETLVHIGLDFLLMAPLFQIPPLVAVSWSLTYEVCFYLAVPLAIEALRLRRWRSSARFLAMLAVTLVGACLFHRAQGGPDRLLMFMAGILAYEAHESRLLAPPTQAVALVVLVLALIQKADGRLQHMIDVVITIAAYFALCLSCFGRPSGWLSRSYSWTPLRWFGNMSYSYYLAHGLGLQVAFLLMEKSLGGALAAEPVWFGYLLLPAFVLSLLPALVLYLAVERPLSLASGPRRLATAPMEPRTADP